MRKSNFRQYLHGGIDRVAMVGLYSMKGGDGYGGCNGLATFPCSVIGHYGNV